MSSTRSKHRKKEKYIQNISRFVPREQLVRKD